MFKKTHRLNRSEFERFFSNGKRYHTKNLQLIYTPYPTLKVAVVVPKKIIKSAVGRNTIRRQLYHQLVPLISNGTGAFIFIAKKNIIEASREETNSDCKELVGVILKSR